VTARYAFIAAEKADADRLVEIGRLHPGEVLPVSRMCAALEVSRSGFYEWRDRAASARAGRRALVAAHAQAAFTLGRGSYGARRVHAILSRSDEPAVASASLKLVRSIMREHGLVACQPRAYRTTTVPDGGGGTIRDHLGRDFTADAPGRKLVGDITYIRTGQGWLYLATVIDCHTRMVVGWSMAEHMRTDLIKAAITMAANRLQLPAGAVFHSDRGSQYTSSDYAKHLAELGVTASMGRTGVCWDNALAESFFGALKNELVHRHVFPTRKRARRAIAEYIEVFYNRVRIHSTLGYKTPHEVLTEYHQNTLIAA
jgi:transposase InsO family protein